MSKLVVTNVNKHTRTVTFKSHLIPNNMRGRNFSPDEVEGIIQGLLVGYDGNLLAHFNDIAIEREYLSRTPLYKAMEENE